MKRLITLLCLFLASFSAIRTTSAFAIGSSSLQSYQNYNHGYCPSCDCAPCTGTCNPEDADPAPCEEPCEDPCAPCAPVCGTECGVSIVAIGIAIAAVAAAAAIIVASGNGSSGHN